jgi:hypothetical protein
MPKIYLMSLDGLTLQFFRPTHTRSHESSPRANKGKDLLFKSQVHGVLYFFTHSPSMKTFNEMKNEEARE